MLQIRLILKVIVGKFLHYSGKQQEGKYVRDGYQRKRGVSPVPDDIQRSNGSDEVHAEEDGS